MVVSAFTRTQIAALFGTAILTILPATMFSGLSTPASAVTGMGRVMGQLFPMTYYLPISVGAFTKGLHFADLGGYVAILSLFFPALVGLSHSCCANRRNDAEPAQHLLAGDQGVAQLFP